MAGNTVLTLELRRPRGGALPLPLRREDLFDGGGADDLLEAARRQIAAACRLQRLRLVPLSPEQERALDAALTGWSLGRPPAGPLALDVEEEAPRAESAPIRRLRGLLGERAAHLRVAWLPTTPDAYLRARRDVGDLAAELGLILHAWSPGAPVQPALPPLVAGSPSYDGRGSGIGADLVAAVEHFARLAGPPRLLLLDLAHAHAGADPDVPAALLRAVEGGEADLLIVVMAPVDEPVAFVPGLITLPGTGLPSWLQDWTDRARAGTLPAVRGRDEAVSRALGVLTSRTANIRSVLLLGDPGVGKTALARAVAYRLAASPEDGWRLLCVDLNALLAGTTLRGQLEARVQAWIALAAEPGTICFVDEFHRCAAGMGMGGGETPLLDWLKEPLSTGRMRLLAASTQTEWQRMNLDPAVDRRFERQELAAPGPEEAADLLAPLARALAADHGVTIGPDVLLHAARQAQRYLPGRALPASAERVLHAAARGASGLGALDARAIDRAIEDSSAAVLPGGPRATRLLEAESHLGRHIVGQPLALRVVSDRLQLAAARGSTDRPRPLASLLFVGPTGVGKTELARRIASLLWDDAERTEILDMSTFQEAHSVSDLLGPPPGFVGYEQGGKLSEYLLRHDGGCVLVFDEAEKAHPDIWQALLGLLDRGEHRDRRGRTAHARGSVLVFTSNLLAAQVAAAMGDARRASDPHRAAEDAAARVREQIGACGAFAPEFMGRLDAVVPFAPLDAAALEQILDRCLAGHNAALAAEPHLLALALDASVRARVLAEAKGGRYGARQLRGAYEQVVELALAPALLRGTFPRGAALLADLDPQGRVCIRHTGRRP